MTDLRPYLWPLSRLSEAIEALAGASKLPVLTADLPAAPALPEEPRERRGALGRWIEAAVGCLGLEVEPAEAPYPELEQLVRGAGPAILQVPSDPDQDNERFLAVVGGSGRKVRVVGPEQGVALVPAQAVAEALSSRFEGPVGRQVDDLLDRAGVPPGRRARARRAILRERLGPARIGGCWLLRFPPGTSFWRQMQHARLPRQLVAFFAGHLVQYLLMLLSWWVIGNAALQGHFDRQWLLAWVLLLITQVPLGLLVSWSQGIFAIGVGGLLKVRLLLGALHLEPEEVRHQGAGQLLGRVIESGAVESMALSAGFSGIVALIELVAAAVVLLVGPGGGLRLLLFLVWIAITCLIGRRYYQHRLGWTDTRLEMTNDLVERMVGHRTRLAQERREHWHDGEDQFLARYLEQSCRLDRLSVHFSVLLSRGWIVLGLFGLIPLLVTERGSPIAVAVALGGILLASRALRSLAESLGALTGAAVAWKQVAPLYHAASRKDAGGSPEVVLSTEGGGRGGAEPDTETRPVIEAHDLVFRYRQQGEPVLRGCSLAVRPGDRLLLEGPSGGGKTTLAALLVGLRRPESGLMLLKGLDWQTLGARGWRRQVVAAPQFHENHVMTGTFSFNLLMGRRWPPEPEDMDEAEAICRELGLGPLLERMPAGLLQVVGETGWRLSHGEQSRLFMARALLQRSDLIVLDESFAALDPDSLRQALQCVLRRAPALLVIAHP